MMKRGLSHSLKYKTRKPKKHLVKEEAVSFKPNHYPDNKLLQKERKVKNRIEKEFIRGGTKYQVVHHSPDKPVDLSKWSNKIICGDSELILKEIPDRSIDIIITSPPYNFGLDYDNDHKNDAVKWEDYFGKLNKVWTECARVLKTGGRFCVNVQPLFSDYIPTHHIISKQMLDLGLLWKGEILWEKNNYNCKYTAWGSWCSPSMPYLKYTWEFVEIFCKVSHKKFGSSNKIDIIGDEFKKWVYAKWVIAPERNMKEFGHPAMFPEELITRLLKLFSYQDDVALDPFNGAGTTTAMAKKLSRKYIGIDISGEYCKKAEDRLKKTSIETSLFQPV
ncbi:MAG: site-specific DNA-methyltransferase [Planctomycetes bacterium]|nr:site-specific DNA-methyltransferase [Planctomycetota bacterium]